MLIHKNQISLADIYSDLADLFKEKRPEFFNLMDQYLDIEKYIPRSFREAYYSDTGRPREYPLYGFIAALVFQKIFTVPTDALLIAILHISAELRKFCGFDKVPDASKLTRFKQDFHAYLEDMFTKLVDVTEPVCQAIDPILASMLAYDTSAIESYVAENNPKHTNSTINRLKAYYKAMNKPISDGDIHMMAYKLMPKTSASDPSIRKMYANGHFCYGRKFGIVTNGLGIPRHIAFFDEEFKRRHENFLFEDIDEPEYDKTLADCKSLIPVLSDFYAFHPAFSHGDFLGDAAFDAVYNYEFLLAKDENGESLFDRAFIPLNTRAASDKPDCPIDEDGIPLCPKDKSLKMKPHGISREEGRPDRQKWVCPKTVQTGTTRACHCAEPCTGSTYGRVFYTYPSKELRLYPGVLRDDDEWSRIYKIRCVVEQSINHIKSNMATAGKKSRDPATTKADVFLAGIASLFTVIIAYNMAKPEYIRSVKKIAC